LLLINGIGASLEALEPFVTALDGAVEVIRFDPPGVGGSPLPPGPYRFGGLCRLIAGMLTELGHDQADVLGISWGGAVAQHFAAFQRDRCRRLVLVATAAGPPIMLASTALHGADHGSRRTGPSRGYYYQLGAVAGWTGVPFLPWLRQPALILAGDDDPIIPVANARLMHRLIRGSRLHVYPGGHLGLLTEAAGLAPVVDGFLSGP
jgi:pimeloyl-ACP methyl ester carboxylesterase